MEVEARRGRKAPTHKLQWPSRPKVAPMTTDLSKQLRELQESTNDLNSLTDKANDIVRRVELFLKEKCRVGGWANVAVPSEDEREGDPDDAWETYLGYERYKG